MQEFFNKKGYSKAMGGKEEIHEEGTRINDSIYQGNPMAPAAGDRSMFISGLPKTIGSKPQVCRMKAFPGKKGGKLSCFYTKRKRGIARQRGKS